MLSVVIFCSYVVLSWLIAQIYSKLFWDRPVFPIFIIGIIFVLHFTCAVFLLQVLYTLGFSASFFTAFLSGEITTSSNKHVPFSLSPVMMSGLLLGMV